MNKLLALIALAAVLAACAMQPVTPPLATELPPDIELQQPRVITMFIGESGATEGNSVVIRFLEVLEDSRCPIGAECASAGRVGILADVTYQQESKTAELWLGETGVTELSYVEFPGLAVFLTAVEPYPRVDVVWERVTTSATFEVRFAGP
ncbi:MAG: hypothetical protein EPO32_02900 [Anaerolineae bacterium]|nr:MAG: hypothetical protein EPO32_02900 [Anaerolineae bacterium]